MGNSKAVFTLDQGTVQLEGSEAFVTDCAAKLVPGQREAERSAMLVNKGLDHAWGWFSLHATHRLQGVDFFLVASAFLSAAYVSALHFDLPGVAACVGALGVAFSVAFYLLETRIRELLKAGEAALYPAQRALAELTAVPEFKICESVERPRNRYSAYSKVIRALYGSSAVASFFGIIYALNTLFLGQYESVAAYRGLIVIAAVVVLYLGQRLVASDRGAITWVHCTAAFVLIAVGAFAFVSSVVRPLR